MAALLGYNRKLAWVIVPALLWACLALALALGAVQVGPPPGGMVVPGRLLRVEESKANLKLVVGYIAEQNPHVERWQREIGSKLPEDLIVEFSVVQPGELRRSGSPDFQLLEPAIEPRQFPGGREVVLTQKYIMLILPRETRLLPRGRDSEATLRRLLEERRGRGTGGRGWQHRNQDKPGGPPDLPRPGELGPPPEGGPGVPPEGQPGGPPGGQPGGPPQNRPGTGHGPGGQHQGN
jgi:hypothetical protein